MLCADLLTGLPERDSKARPTAYEFVGYDLLTWPVAGECLSGVPENDRD
jgi:hypothetical protein